MWASQRSHVGAVEHRNLAIRSGMAPGLRRDVAIVAMRPARRDFPKRARKLAHRDAPIGSPQRPTGAKLRWAETPHKIHMTYRVSDKRPGGKHHVKLDVRRTWRIVNHLRKRVMDGD
jgi:hypothetical protein